MKKTAALILFIAALSLVGCAGGNNSTNPVNLSGIWNATLTDTSGGATVFNFGTTLVVKGDGTLSVTNFTFSSDSPCFVSGGTQSGAFALSGNFNGNVTGTFQYTVTSGDPIGNTLVLNGAVNGNSITGTWTLTGGTGCTGSGNFVMVKA